MVEVVDARVDIAHIEEADTLEDADKREWQLVVDDEQSFTAQRPVLELDWPDLS